MAARFPFTHMMLVALACAGFCGLGWNQLTGAPVVTYLEQVMQKVPHGDTRLFATSNQESLRGVGQPDLVEVVPFVFGIGKELTLGRPVFDVLANAATPGAVGENAFNESTKNKDPPAV